MILVNDNPSWKLREYIKRKIGNIKIYRMEPNIMYNKIHYMAVTKKKGYLIAFGDTILELYFNIIKEIKNEGIESFFVPRKRYSARRKYIKKKK